VLSGSSNTNSQDLNQYILRGKGVLEGKGQAFIDAAALYNVNELYLIAHSILETGNGSSTLSNGVLVSKVDGVAVDPRTVYNMYGAGAYDGSAIRSGAEYAYKQGWFTPEAAIIGGARFISERYINNPLRLQNTIYKMRWDPEAGFGAETNRMRYQYATDVGWARKIGRLVGYYYSLVGTNQIPTFDVPSYELE
jgi:mannosyl-glycoprotein endo-beta-N-acetylglucosaminidase